MTFKAILTGGAVAASLALPASAQSSCIDYEPLRRVFEESQITLQGSGQVQESGRVEIWSSPNGEWAILAINPMNIACIVISGEGWVTPEPA